MKKIYIIILLFFSGMLTANQKIFAGDTASVKKTDTISAASKICSCQLLNVQATRNSEEQIVAIFAEKTPEGKSVNDYRLMDEYIRREKIYFEIVFVKSVEIKERIKSQTDCMSLYIKLRAEISQLQIYNILNVDILSTIAKR
jgi:hypothetical protein